MPIDLSVLNGVHSDNIFVPGTGSRPPESMTDRLSAVESSKLDTAGAFMSGYKNKIINGNFDIWQRGTTQTTNGYGSDDRWYSSNIGSTKTHSQQSFALGQTDVPGNPKYFSRTAVSSVAGASNYAIKYQSIEDVRTLSGSTATLSFWAKADANKQMAVDFYQSFGTGGSPSANISGIAAQKISLTSVWQKFTITATIPSVTGKTLGTDGNSCVGVVFWFDAGTNYNSRTNSLGHQSGTFDIAQVQLEEGSIATPFESRHIAQELALCQRYYLPFIHGSSRPGLRLRSYAPAGGTQVNTGVLFPTEMRDIPTATIVGTWGVTNCGQPQIGSVSKAGFEIYASSVATGMCDFWPGSPGVGVVFDAEL